jgi:hypothetical protein
MWWWLATSWAAPCAAPSTASQLADALARGEAAYLASDSATFAAAADEIAVRAPCLDAPVSPALAAQIHRLTALRRWSTAPSIARAHWAAARRAVDDLDVVAFVGPDHPLAREAVGPATGASRMPKPEQGALWVDGEATRARPLDQAALLQLLEPDGAQQTWMLTPNDPTPPYPAVPKARAPLRLAGLGAAVVAGAAYGVAWSSAGRFDDPALDAEQLRAARAQTNVSTAAAAVAAGSSLGCVGLSFVLR